MRLGRRSLILEHGAVTVSGPLLVFSAYLLFVGHNQPGGGFAAGLVAGVAVVLAWAAGGQATVRRVLPFRSSALLGLGLVVASGTGFASLLVGAGFLQSGYLEVAIPLIGKVKVVSALAFDTGVYLVVVGMALGLVRALASEDGT
jgi:multicomponent Na+:H+ antiporter subunit A